jgi:hypothetical protein
MPAPSVGLSVPWGNPVIDAALDEWPIAMPGRGQVPKGRPSAPTKGEPMIRTGMVTVALTLGLLQIGCGGSRSGTTAAAPAISSVSPTSGPTAGGTVVTLTGTGFQAGDTVTFGSAVAASTVDSATQITATTPPGSFGAVDVTVAGSGAPSAVLSGGFGYLRFIEREQSDRTAWWWYHGVSAADVASSLTANAARLVDVHVERAPAGVPTFSVIMVENSGPYSKSTWNWYCCDTETELNLHLTQTKSRLISLSPYWDGATVRFASVTVDDTGLDTLPTPWSWGTFASMYAQVSALSNFRLVDFENFDNNGSVAYFFLAIPNTGVESAAWWWWVNFGRTDLDAFILENSAQPLSLIADSSGSYDAVLRSSGTAGWWYLYGVTPAQVLQFAADNSARATQARANPGASGTYDVVMIQN